MKRGCVPPGGWHEAMVPVWLPLAAAMGLSPLHIPTLWGSQRFFLGGGMVCVPTIGLPSPAPVMKCSYVLWTISVMWGCAERGVSCGMDPPQSPPHPRPYTPPPPELRRSRRGHLRGAPLQPLRRPTPGGFLIQKIKKAGVSGGQQNLHSSNRWHLRGNRRRLECNRRRLESNRRRLEGNRRRMETKCYSAKTRFFR